MIVYLDTSALVKLFFEEQHSAQVQQWVSASAIGVVSQLAWTEVCAAIAMKRRIGQASASQCLSALSLLREDWARFHRLGTDAELFDEAGELALSHDLRAYDGVQLASARRAWLAAGAALVFCSFDKQLNAAARTLGLSVLEP